MRARIGNRIGDNCFLKNGMVGIIIRRAQSARVGGAAAFSRGETSFTPRSRFNALKRLEATKRAVSRDYADQRLARAETKPAISFGFRFVSLRSVSLAPSASVMTGYDARKERARVRVISTRAPSARCRQCRSTS
jgi:hypothetical protein